MNAPAPRLSLRVRGVVQGVGLRPFAYGLAQRLDLAGFVLNDGEGVRIEIEGRRTGEFVEALRSAPPPLARIDAVEVAACAPRGEAGFAIAASQAGRTRTRIGADAAVCEACLADLFDPQSRFHLYPLVNCTHCGPRYTIARALPYDRAATSMAPFPLCEACARDYADPANRRFHAEPIACRDCGPALSHSIDEIARVLAQGGIAAVKGLGGYQLMCDARDEVAVARLRARKGRDAKPFAALTLNAASAALYARMNAEERRLFESVAAPIVLLRAGARRLAPSVAPGLREIGVMRANTPLHWLILHALAGKPDFAGWRDAPSDAALVATSANIAGEPLIADDSEARARLAGVADLVVSHARAIVTRVDDSVARWIDGGPVYLRRARGFVPDPIDLGFDTPCLIAHGGDLKNTFTLTRGREAFVSQHIGDLDNLETLRFRAETLARLQALLDIEPEIAVCDLHPDFVSTRAAEASGLPVMRVQHHLAHVAATAAECGWTRALGVALDGFGYGADGGAWGGELIALEGAKWRRVGWLSPLALLGGDKAAREPWRMGVAMLMKLGRGGEAARLFPHIPQAPSVARGGRSSETTSLGRLFDAIAALASVCDVQRYEGQAAMQLEALAGPAAPTRAWRLEAGVLDLSPFAAHLLDAGLRGREAASAFHATLAAALAEWIGEAARAHGFTRIALGGGCVVNRTLTEDVCARLRAYEFEVALPRAVPAGDGGLSFGQAAYAARALAEGRTCV